MAYDVVGSFDYLFVAKCVAHILLYTLPAVVCPLKVLRLLLLPAVPPPLGLVLVSSLLLWLWLLLFVAGISVAVK